MSPTELIEVAVLLVVMAILITLVLRWVRTKPALLQERDPKDGLIKPAFICRGGWREGEIRGCAHGYPATGIPVEPVNTYSNLAYLAAGWILYRVVGGGTALVFAVAMGFLCFGSALYHGVKTRWSARWDHGGMYAVVGGLAFYVVVAGSTAETWIVLIASAIFGVLLAWFLDGHLMARMALLMALVTAGVFTGSGDHTVGGYALGALAIAIIVWMIDKWTSLLGRVGHGLWHLFTAAGLALMFVAVRGFPASP